MFIKYSLNFTKLLLKNQQIILLSYTKQRDLQADE